MEEIFQLKPNVSNKQFKFNIMGNVIFLPSSKMDEDQYTLPFYNVVYYDEEMFVDDVDETKAILNALPKEYRDEFLQSKKREKTRHKSYLDSKRMKYKNTIKRIYKNLPKDIYIFLASKIFNNKVQPTENVDQLMLPISLNGKKRLNQDQINLRCANGIIHQYQYACYMQLDQLWDITGCNHLPYNDRYEHALNYIAEYANENLDYTYLSFNSKKANIFVACFYSAEDLVTFKLKFG